MKTKCRLIASSEDELKYFIYEMKTLFSVTNVTIKKSSNTKYPESNFLAYLAIEE